MATGGVEDIDRERLLAELTEKKRLRAQRRAELAQLHYLETTAVVQPEQVVDLLDALPILETVNITHAPEALQRNLYDALQLTIHYDRPDQGRFRIVLTDDIVHALATSAGIAETTTRAHEPGTPPGQPCSDQHQQGL